jgi:hypothetical protein
MKAKLVGYFKQCMILYSIVPERSEAIVHKILIIQEEKQEFGDGPAQYTIT